MGGNADIQQDAVHAVDAQIVQRLTHIHKIGLYQGGGQSRQPRTRRGDGVGVLVQRDQPTGGQPGGDGVGVSPAAGGAVQINAVGTDGQRLYGLIQQHRTVIGLFRHPCHLTYFHIVIRIRT